MLVFAIENYDSCATEMVGLGEAHRDEIKPHADAFPFDPDMNLYARLDEVGMLHVATARAMGRLVGYMLSVVMPSHQHHKSVRWASGDGVYLLPAYRKPRVADRLLAFAEDSLRAKGVILNVIGVHPDHPALGRLLVRRGYALSSHGHSRRL